MYEIKGTGRHRGEFYEGTNRPPQLCACKSYQILFVCVHGTSTLCLSVYGCHIEHSNTSQYFKVFKWLYHLSFYYSVKEKLQAMLNLDRDFTDEDAEKVLVCSLLTA